jgi:hypothetical protein
MDDPSPPHQTFEYRVIPAPRQGEKARGVRSPEGRFALAMSRLFNRMGADGWEFVRADTLPAEHRVGLTGKELRYHALLVFRRALPPEAAPAPAPAEIAAPARPLLLTDRTTGAPGDWPGFDETVVEDAQVIDLLAARARPARPAAE